MSMAATYDAVAHFDSKYAPLEYPDAGPSTSSSRRRRARWAMVPAFLGVAAALLAFAAVMGPLSGDAQDRPAAPSRVAVEVQGGGSDSGFSNGDATTGPQTDRCYRWELPSDPRMALTFVNATNDVRFVKGSLATFRFVAPSLAAQANVSGHRVTDDNVFSIESCDYEGMFLRYGYAPGKAPPSERVPDGATWHHNSMTLQARPSPDDIPDPNFYERLDLAGEKKSIETRLESLALQMLFKASFIVHDGDAGGAMQAGAVSLNAVFSPNQWIGHDGPEVWMAPGDNTMAAGVSIPDLDGKGLDNAVIPEGFRARAAFRFTASCAEGSWSPSGSGTDCTAWDACGKGQVEAPNSEPDGLTDHVCNDCPAGFFSARKHNLKCKPWVTCGHGLFIARDATPSRQRLCAKCKPGRFSRKDGDTKCRWHHKCKAGKGLLHHGGPTHDTVCEDCPGGRFSLTASYKMCRKKRECPPGTYVEDEGHAKENRMCAACPSGTFNAWRENAAQCQACQECPAGTHLDPTKVCNARQDSRCVPCLPHTWSDKARANSLEDPSCRPHTQCGIGQFMSVIPTAIRDRECKACPEGKFNRGVANLAFCYGHSDCPPGKFIAKHPSKELNRLCIFCSFGYFADKVNSQSCKPWTECKSGEIVLNEETVGGAEDRRCGTEGEEEKEDEQEALEEGAPPQVPDVPYTASYKEVAEKLNVVEAGDIPTEKTGQTRTSVTQHYTTSLTKEKRRKKKMKRTWKIVEKFRARERRKEKAELRKKARLDKKWGSEREGVETESAYAETVGVVDDAV